MNRRFLLLRSGRQEERRCNIPMTSRPTVLYYSVPENISYPADPTLATLPYFGH